MRITQRPSIGWTVLVCAGLLSWLGGCAPERQPTPPASQPALTMQEESHQRVVTLRSAVASFQEHANALPGSDDAEHRQIMQQVFDDLSTALPILVGEEPSAHFACRCAASPAAREELAANPTLAPEPIEDSGLRSAVAAMGRIAHEDFYSGTEHAADKLRIALRPLDRTSGPMHRLAVRDIVRQMAEVLQTLADKYEDKVEAPPKHHHKHHSN